tara:strand:- start:43 stop:837 length:795 start_codon:yes stop_codon:yes gene_type:complete
MSILAEQNINNFNPQASEGSGGQKQRRWVRSLGRDSQGITESRSSTHAGNGFGGFAYAPDGLGSIVLSRRWRTGPQGQAINSSFAPRQYGPRDFGTLGPDNHRRYRARYSSVLSSFAFMIGKGGRWGRNNIAQNMKQTFTSGDQMISLWNRERDSNIGQTPIASGGPVAGYQASHKYGITNRQAAGTVGSTITGGAASWAHQIEGLISGGNISLDEGISAMGELAKNRDPTTLGTLGAGREEVARKLFTVDTGIRNIPGMTGNE